MSDRALLDLAATARLTTRAAMKALGVSRATAQRRLRSLVADGWLRPTTARGRDVAYVIAPFRKRWKRTGADEHEAWKALEAWLEGWFAL